MDMWDYMMLNVILTFIGGVLLSGGLVWAFRRLHPVAREIRQDWRAFRAARRRARKRAAYAVWKQSRALALSRRGW